MTEKPTIWVGGALPPELSEGLLMSYQRSDPRLDIWRRYPEFISEAEDAFTDHWACQEVSREFAAFARERGWSALVIHAEGAKHPFADYHYWVRLTHARLGVFDVDWTARQYHNLEPTPGHDLTALDLPWPLVWDPVVAPDVHPIVGAFDTVRHLR